MDRVVLLSATTYTLFGLASILTIGRALSRWRGLRGEGYGWDDGTCFFTYACVVGLAVADYFQIENGLGQQSFVLDGRILERFLLWRYISQHFYIAVVFGAKLSLVLLYLRRWYEKSGFRTACWILVSALVCAFVALEVVAIIQCLPITSNWRNLSAANATCIDKSAYVYSLAGVDVAFNVVVLLFPAPRLRKVETSSVARKIGIGLAFLVGLAVIAISALRIAYLDFPIPETDPTWNTTYSALYSSIEALLLQIGICIPAITLALTHSLQTSTRLPDSSRKSASTSQSGGRSSSGVAVIGIKGIGPSDPEKGHLGPKYGSHDYERAPSPTIGLQPNRTWEEVASRISQVPPAVVHAAPRQSTQFPIVEEEEEEETFWESSSSSTEDMRESDEDALDPGSEARRRAMTFGMPSIIGMPSIVSKEEKRELSSFGARPHSMKLETEFTLPFTTDEVRIRPSRLDVHSW